MTRKRTLVAAAVGAVMCALLVPGWSAGPAAGSQAPAVHGSGSATASAAPARTYHACVNRRTGQMRLVRAAKKCRRGERRITWSDTGPAGATGPAGPTGATGATGPAGPRGYTPVVRDGTGAVVTDVVGAYDSGIERLVGDGVFYYWLSGVLAYEPIEDGWYTFLSGDCSGPPHIMSYPSQVPGSLERIVIRGPDQVTKTAYGYTATVTAMAPGDTYSDYGLVGGVVTCIAHLVPPGGGGQGRALAALGPAPPDLPGPVLTYSFA